MRYKKLRHKITKRMKNDLEETYGFKVPNDWMFYHISENRIWLLTPELENFDYSNLSVETMGLYFCYYDYDRLRLSPEAAQLIGPLATKNVLFISPKQVEELIRGFDIDIITNLDAEYIILNTAKGFIGVGKNHKTKVLCQFRKNRRIRKL